MAWTQADVDTLQAAIADGRGARQISFGDQSVTFGSVDDMQKLLSMMRREVAGTSSVLPRNYRVAATSKGV